MRCSHKMRNDYNQRIECRANRLMLAGADECNRMLAYAFSYGQFARSDKPACALNAARANERAHRKFGLLMTIDMKICCEPSANKQCSVCDRVHAVSFLFAAYRTVRMNANGAAARSIERYRFINIMRNGMAGI